MNTYTSNIVSAALLFPLIAFLITVPYMVYQYRKHGSIPWLRTLTVYSLVFYLMCAYFLVLLPLPENRAAVVPYAQTPQLVPFNFVREFLAETSFSLADPGTWLGVLRDPYVYEAFFNVLLLVPLGMYLRYYFRRTWWQTLAIGFLVTLSFETTQLTGLWGIYQHPYRLFDVDDLILNTLGAMVGFWMVGPAMRVLPDIRLVNAEAQEKGVRASVTKRALSFLIDVAIASAASMALGALRLAVITGMPSTVGAWFAPAWVGWISLATFFVVVPALTHGQTLGQKLLRLRIVRPDASPAHWYQYLARYGLLYLFAMLPFMALTDIVHASAPGAGELDAIGAFVAANQRVLVVAWLILVGVWAVSLVVRAVRSAATKRPFVMLNGLLSNTRVMTELGVRAERERRVVLDVQQVRALELELAENGTSLAQLMDRAGRAVAAEVRAWVPEPAPVAVLAGSGNNGGDGWVAALDLAEAGYPVTLIAPDLAERLHAEPARTAAMDAFAQATERKLPLRVLIAPDVDVLAHTVDQAHAVIDAMLGTGFAGAEVREPYAAWIEAANRRRFEGSRGKGRGRHRKRAHERARHEHRGHEAVRAKTKDAPFAVAVDVPSGLSAQTGAAAHPCFAADLTVTMLAFKPGLLSADAARWTGVTKLARLQDQANQQE